MQFWMVSSSGMLVKRLSTSRLAITQSGSSFTTSSEKENESWTVKSLTAKGDKKRTKKFARLYVGVPMADNIGRKNGQLFWTGLCTLARPYKIPGLDPVG